MKTLPRAAWLHSALVFTLWVRRRSKNFSSSFRPTPRCTSRSANPGPEHWRKLAIQRNIRGRHAPRDDCWLHRSIRRFDKWRGARQWFKLS